MSQLFLFASPPPKLGKPFASPPPKLGILFASTPPKLGILFASTPPKLGIPNYLINFCLIMDSALLCSHPHTFTFIRLKILENKLLSFLTPGFIRHVFVLQIP